MSLENLDVLDRAIVCDIVAGRSDEEIIEAHGVDAEKVAALHGHCDNNPEDVEEAKAVVVGVEPKAGGDVPPVADAAAGNEAVPPADAPAEPAADAPQV